MKKSLILQRNMMSAKDRVPDSFELEANSFPPLPGSQNNNASNGVFESRMSDIVRGTAKQLDMATSQDPKPVSVS